MGEFNDGNSIFAIFLLSAYCWSVCVLLTLKYRHAARRLQRKYYVALAYAVFNSGFKNAATMK